MSLVVVATTEQSPFGDDEGHDRRPRRGPGSGEEGTEEQNATGDDGRQQLQPHESHIATFVQIPSCDAGGHCAHYICPITASNAPVQNFIIDRYCAGNVRRIAILNFRVWQAQRMTDPVCDKDGHAYERTAILQRLANGAPVSPISKAPLTAAQLTTDHALKYVCLPTRRTSRSCVQPG